MYVWNVITDDVIDDNDWYETMLLFMIILIWDDVVIDDNDWYETLLVSMIILIWNDVVIDDNIDLRLCWCLW